MKVGVIVKMSQNVLIGVAAFILAVVWTFKKAEGSRRAETRTHRDLAPFPKFVLGFMAASILFSFFLNPEIVGAVKSQLGGSQGLLVRSRPSPRSAWKRTSVNWPPWVAAGRPRAI